MPPKEVRFPCLCRKFMKYDLFSKGIIYDFCSFVSVMHVATYLNYNRIIFAGIDLYDHRYFWLPYNTLRDVTKRRGRSLNTKHFVAKYTCSFIEYYKNIFIDKKLYVLNSKSLLADYIETWRM